MVTLHKIFTGTIVL